MNKIKFVDEQGSNLNAYKVIKGDGSTEYIKLLRNADITQAGTPLNAENLNLVMDDINELDGRVVDIGYLYTSVDDFALRVYNKALTISSETNTNTGRLYIAKVLDNVVVGQYSHDRVFISIPYESGKYFTRYVYTISGGQVSGKEDLTPYSKEEQINTLIREYMTANYENGNTGAY